MSLATRFASAAALALCLCAMPSRASAQAVTGTLLGNITDSSGGTVPGVSVTAAEVQTNISRTTVSNDAGHYTFSSLPNGRYTVSAELQGFKRSSGRTSKSRSTRPSAWTWSSRWAR